MSFAENMWKDWAEVSGILLLLVGFFVALSLDSAFLIYLVIFLAGLMAGKYYFSKIGKQPLFPFFLIIIGFLFGYLLGAFSANRKIVAVLFFAGWIISHIAHKKGYIKG